MTRITQISATAMLAVFASTAFVSTADARAKKVWCKETSSKLFRTACEERKHRKLKRYVPPTFPNPDVPVLYNFRGRTNEELGNRTLNGGNDGGGTGDGGGNGGQGGRR